MPYEASPLPLGIELDIEAGLRLRFPPQGVRGVQGKVARRARAIFRSERRDRTLVE